MSTSEANPSRRRGGRVRSVRAYAACGVLLACLVAQAAPAHAGTWSQVNLLPPAGNPANVALLTDGRLLVSGGDSTPNWNKWWTLTPDSAGSYENGTWAAVGDSAYGRLFNPAFVLNNGKYLVCGGEYVCPANNILCGGGPSGFADRATCEIFDPVSNSWSVVPDMPSRIDDTPSALMPDGRVLILSYNTSSDYLFDVILNNWVTAAPYDTAAIQQEGGSLLLPDGSVLVGSAQFARYVPDVWGPTASTATIPGGVAVGEFLLSPFNAEIGPFLLMWDGRALILGGNNKNGLYNYQNNTWALVDPTPIGPDPTKPYNHADAPSSMEPDGTALTIVTDDQSGVGTTLGHYYEFNPAAAPGAQWTALSGPPQTSGFVGNPERTRLLPLPSGQVVVTQAENNGTVWLYRSAGTPQAAWRPTIASTPILLFGNYLLDGTQLNGLTTGGDFGDDGKVATNFPVVTLVKGSSVYYARSFSFDQMGPRPNVKDSCWFHLPAGIPNGTYNVHVTASGVDSSNTVPLTLPALDLGPATTAGLSLLLS
jgi:hypothetical protein